jgi:hypothetical protein
MNEVAIHSQIEEVIEKIKNKNDIQGVIEDINEISKNIYELPLYHDYIEMIVLFNETYNTCLVANRKGE